MKLHLLLHLNLKYPASADGFGDVLNASCGMVMDCLIPVMQTLEKVADENGRIDMTVAVSPLLLEILSSDDFRLRLGEYADMRARRLSEDMRYFARSESSRMLAVADYWLRRTERTLYWLADRQGSLSGALFELEKKGLEVIPCVASDVPLNLSGEKGMVAQIQLGCEAFRRLSGHPAGGLLLRGVTREMEMRVKEVLNSSPCSGLHYALFSAPGITGMLTHDSSWQSGLAMSSAYPAGSSMPSAGENYLNMRSELPGSLRYWRGNGQGADFIYNPDAAGAAARDDASHFLQQQAGESADPPVLHILEAHGAFGEWQESPEWLYHVLTHEGGVEAEPVGSTCRTEGELQGKTEIGLAANESDAVTRGLIADAEERLSEAMSKGDADGNRRKVLRKAGIELLLLHASAERAASAPRVFSSHMDSLDSLLSGTSGAEASVDDTGWRIFEKQDSVLGSLSPGYITGAMQGQHP